MQTVTEILIDFSSSMQEKLSITKSTILNDIIPNLDYSYRIGVKTFSTGLNNTPLIKTILPLSVTNKEQLVISINSLANPNGNTPISVAIKNSISSLKEFRAFDKKIILITDGAENCGGDYKEEVKKAIEDGFNCQIHIIGIGLNEVAIKQAKSIANETKGTFSPIPYTKGATYSQNANRSNLSSFYSAVKPLVRQVSIISPHLQKPGYSQQNNIQSSRQVTPTQTSSPKPTIIQQPNNPTKRNEQNSETDQKNQTLTGNSKENECPIEPSLEKENSKNKFSNGVEDTLNQVLLEPLNPIVNIPSDILASPPEEVGNSLLEKKSEDKEVSQQEGITAGTVRLLLSEIKSIKKKVKKLNKEKSIDFEENPELNERIRKASEEFLNELLIKKYGERVKWLNKDGESYADHDFEILDLDGSIELYIECKGTSQNDLQFYMTKNEWRLFLNHTKNYQIYFIKYSLNKPTPIFIDNLLDWFLKGKIVPYQKEKQVLKEDRVVLTILD